MIQIIWSKCLNYYPIIQVSRSRWNDFTSFLFYVTRKWFPETSMEEFMKLYQKCQTLASKVYGNYMRKTYKYVNSVRLPFFKNYKCRRENNFSWKSTYKYRGTLYTLEALNSTSWKLEFFISLGKADIALYLLYICHQIHTHLKFT